MTAEIIAVGTELLLGDILNTDAQFLAKELTSLDIGESLVEEAVRDLMAQKNPTITPYVKNGDIALRITAQAKTVEDAHALIAPVKQEIVSRCSDFVYGVSKEILVSKVLRYCMKEKLTLATAESCTAGLIAAAIGDIPGVSDIFFEGFVTYSNEAKEKNLGVPHDILEAHGAVSEETARAMAEGVCKCTGADIGISATGIAGPGGGSKDKPVGLVYIGVCIRGKTTVRKCLHKGSRSRVRHLTVLNAFDEVRKRLIIPVNNK